MSHDAKRRRMGNQRILANESTSRSNKNYPRTGYSLYGTAGAAYNSQDVDWRRSHSHTKTTAKRKAPAEPEPDIDFEVPQVLDEEAEIVRRRRRREELLSKLQAAEKEHKVDTPLQVEETPDFLASPGGVEASSPKEAQPVVDTPAVLPRSPNHQDLELSAADYDPIADMRADLEREAARQGLGDSQALNGSHGAALPPTEPSGANKSADTDEDDDFDMFADDFDEKVSAPKPALAQGAVAAVVPANGGGILEDDDSEGYYKIRVGEMISGRYRIETTLGKGMFSGVVRALDSQTNQPVAIKMMRNNDALRKGGFTEIAILQKLNARDPESRKHIIKFVRHFDYKSHLCLVFESMSLNLREVLRKVGHNVGINLTAVRWYARQLFIALAHLKSCSIIHADLKPDNILVSENRAILKICDLGTAIDRSDAATSQNDVTPYLVSRFYRAPEIMLGLPYDYAVDMWSVGCTLFELYTGKFLFTGESNNQMLKSMMEIRGKISSKLYKHGELSSKHFDDRGNFMSCERDRTGKVLMKVLPVIKPTRDLRTRVLAATDMGHDESRMVNDFVDLLDRCLKLNPARRITPEEALAHPFVRK